jgi:hypothetical protein
VKKFPNRKAAVVEIWKTQALPGMRATIEQGIECVHIITACGPIESAPRESCCDAGDDEQMKRRLRTVALTREERRVVYLTMKNRLYASTDSRLPKLKPGLVLCWMSYCVLGLLLIFYILGMIEKEAAGSNSLTHFETTKH